MKKHTTTRTTKTAHVVKFSRPRSFGGGTYYRVYAYQTILSFDSLNAVKTYLHEQGIKNANPHWQRYL